MARYPVRLPAALLAPRSPRGVGLPWMAGLARDRTGCGAVSGRGTREPSIHGSTRFDWSRNGLRARSLLWPGERLGISPVPARGVRFRGAVCGGLGVAARATGPCGSAHPRVYRRRHDAARGEVLSRAGRGVDSRRGAAGERPDAGAREPTRARGSRASARHHRRRDPRALEARRPPTDAVPL